MSYVLSVIHPPVKPAAFGKAEVFVETVRKVDTAYGAIGVLLKAGAEPEDAFRLGLSLVEQPTGVTVGQSGFQVRIDPADNAPHPCPCCGRLVLPEDHGQADMDDSFCVGCFTWSSVKVPCLPANTAHTEEP